MNKDIFRYGITLFAITFIVGLILSGVNLLTKDRILNVQTEEQNEAKKIVIQGIDYNTFEELAISGNNPTVLGVWKALKGETPVAFVVNVQPKGYGGAIDMMVGISEALSVIDTRIISHSETAGLGSKAADPSFTDQLKGKTKDITVKKNGSPEKNEVIAISSATITTNAVAEGIKAAIEEVEHQIKTAVPISSPSLTSTEGGGENE